MSGDLQNSSKLNLSNRAKVIIAIILIGFAVMARFMPHPPNFAPIAAVALFSGVFLPRRMALLLPLMAMVVSDVFLGFHGLILWTWGSFIVIGLFSLKILKNHYNPATIVGASIGASIFFYLVTNFGVWQEGLLYPHTFSGLANSYINALPFFRNTLLGDLFFVGLIFSAYELTVSATKQFKAKLTTV